LTYFLHYKLDFIFGVLLQNLLENENAGILMAKYIKCI